MEKNIVIRKETPNDYHKVEHMTMRAFWNIHSPGCNEHLLVRKIRASKEYLPEFSRIAEVNGKIAGAIFYTKAKIVDKDKEYEIVTFGPLAVEPTLQNSGVGKALLDETTKLVKDAGYSGICITGEPWYYPKRGFITCDKLGITDSEGRYFDALMALPLDKEKFSKVKGRLIESNAFEEAENEDEINAMNGEFPPYRKVKIKDGFLMIFDNRFGVIEKADGNEFVIRFWELKINAELSDEMKKDNIIPKPGDDILFLWKNNGKSVITSVCKNLL